MPLKEFICPDNVKIHVHNCLSEGGCRMGDRCATRSYLRLASSDRPWTGKPSTTQLIQGTMQAFLKLTNEYAVSPDGRAFMIHGTKGHAALEAAEDEYSLLEERFDGPDTEITGIADVIEFEDGKNILIDYKTSGSYKVAKALGFTTIDEPTGELFKSGPRKGQQKTRKVLIRDDSRRDILDWQLQLNKYRMEAEKRGVRIDELRIQCVVRDGGTYISRSRGVFRNVYYFKIPIMPDSEISAYFAKKKAALERALKQGFWNDICDRQENWDGIKCARYCEVADFCPFGKYLKQEKEKEDMAIKNLSEVRRLPRLGKIRLGIKKVTESGKEYPAEVDYFILDPQTPSELENKKLVDEFHKRYGDQPKQIPIMIPVGDPEVVFPQFYKRYGSASSLKCKGDGVEAVCSSQEFTQGLKVIGKTELGLPRVECKGEDCPWQKSKPDGGLGKECGRSATLQVLLPELPGAGVWQITTGSYNSIVNLNSCLDYVRAVAGRFHMLPLKLERREQEITHEGKKRNHYILHLNMDIALADLQKFAQIDSTKILLELPAPEEAKEDILYQENTAVNPEPVKEEKKEEPKSPDTVDVFVSTFVSITPQSIQSINDFMVALCWTPPMLKHNLQKLFKVSELDELTEEQAKQFIKALDKKHKQILSAAGKATE